MAPWVKTPDTMRDDESSVTKTHVDKGERELKLQASCHVPTKALTHKYHIHQIDR